VRNALALQSFVRSDITVEAQLGTDLPSCPLDGHLVARAVENLVRNAVEAMPEGGRVTVRTNADWCRDWRVGASVTVQDTGVGMDSRSSARAFEDFFTTKPHGSGLGLPFIKRVMQAHDGRVEMTTKRGGGTSVTLHFLSRSDGIHAPR